MKSESKIYCLPAKEFFELSEKIDKLILSYHDCCTKDYKRLDQLVSSLESTEECMAAYKKLEKHYGEIRPYLPEGIKNSAIRKLDDCFTEILIIYEEFFYKAGFKDGIRQSR